MTLTPEQRSAASTFAHTWEENPAALAARSNVTGSLARQKKNVPGERPRVRTSSELGARSPDHAANMLAGNLALAALPPLEQELHKLELETIGLGWTVRLPAGFDPDAAALGFPLLGAVSPAAMGELAQVRIALGFYQLDTPPLRQRLSYFTLSEATLWTIAHAAGARTGETIPYAFRYQQSRYFWPDLGQQQLHNYALCLRCGTTLARKRASKDPGLCQHCAKETDQQRTWPEHAIAPAGRGTWWLACQGPGCTLAFQGTRRAEYHDDACRQRAHRA